MMRPRLRLYNGPDEEVDVPNVTISLGELTAILDAVSRCDHAWIHDFSHDDVQISEDLFEVLAEYNRLRPGA